MIPHL
jgi:ADP-ribosylation factor-like protein 6